MKKAKHTGKENTLKKELPKTAGHQIKKNKAKKQAPSNRNQPFEHAVINPNKY